MPELNFYDALMRLYRGVSAMQNREIRNNQYTDISVSELTIMRFIASQSAPTMSEIAAKLQVTQGTLTVAMNRLVKKGYVDRYRMEQDRRIVRTVLTDMGYGALKEEERFRKRLQQLHKEALGEERAKEFVSMLRELDHYLRDQEDMKE